jgi:two-component system phosphate regulon sensor histidine kinase PhoR
MFIDTLREDRAHDPEERRPCLTVIDQELGRLDGLVGRLIELSKIEHRPAAFSHRVVNASDIVSAARVGFESVKGAGEVELQVEVGPELAACGDRAALAQAVSNLLANAGKHTPAQGKKIELVATADARHVTIAVVDNGDGIPRREQKASFEKCRRGSSADNRRGPGSGLGLALVRAIVVAHRGRIDAKSDGVRGARSCITLSRRLETA